MFLVCGEALYDLFASGDSDGSDIGFDGRIGGSPMNVAIGMARLQVPTALLTGISTDLLGSRILAALLREGVDTRYITRSGRPTTLSLVGLDGAGQPSYAFYGNGSADCSLTEHDLPVLDRTVKGLHFGSYAIAVEPVATALAALAQRESSRFISLDPNVRITVEPRLNTWRRRINAMRKRATLIKVSDEDLALLYPDTDPLETARDWAQSGPSMVVLTRGGDDVIAYRGTDEIRVTPPRVEIVDTVGAGDAFQASLLASLAAKRDPGDFLRESDRDILQEILARAARAAAIVCSRRGANPPHLEDLE